MALRPEIDALKNSSNKDNISDNSQGKLDRWEWDSGARDMSPVPKSIVKNTETFTKEEFKVSTYIFLHITIRDGTDVWLRRPGSDPVT
ncbi:hypothetical protein NQ317_000577 [Molorchus minor]|uniref:Uncharacterized protein n=1 Tax=Molorchus minor TaxID=1323400 RepID=A0ABQ9IZN7_9CUCU|nr:hypothetical protein NQ317_000577 [Molorchus minor]